MCWSACNHMSAQSWFSKKHGIATLVALGDKGVTRLTQVVHRQPARLLPMRGALAEAAGAAHVAIGSYGGGLVGGDKVDVTVKAQNGASLLLGTQASTKVYRTHGQAASQEFDCTVDAGSLLVYAPDPLVPFANSAYAGTQRFELQPGASLVAVDWVGAGRAICGERWTFKSYSSRTEVHLAARAARALHKARCGRAVSLQPGCHAQRATSFDVGGVSRDAAVSVIVSGPRTHAVAKRLHAASATLAQRRTGWAARDARGRSSILRTRRVPLRLGTPMTTPRLAGCAATSSLVSQRSPLRCRVAPTLRQLSWRAWWRSTTTTSITCSITAYHRSATRSASRRTTTASTRRAWPPACPHPGRTPLRWSEGEAPHRPLEAPSRRRRRVARVGPGRGRRGPTEQPDQIPSAAA